MRRVLSALALLPVFVLAAALGLLLHLDTPPAKRVIVSRANAMLAETTRGRLVVTELGSLGLFGVKDLSLEAASPEGRRLARVTGLSVGLDAARLLGSLLGDGPLLVRVTSFEVRHAEAVLEETARGRLSLVESLEPRRPKPPERTPGRALELSVDAIRVGHVWAHGAMRAVGPIDVEARALSGALRSRSAGLTVVLDSVDVEARNVRGAFDAQARVTGKVSRAVGSPPEGEATLEGSAGPLSLRLEAAHQRGRLRARLELDPARASELRRLGRRLGVNVPVYEPVGARIVAHGPLDDLRVRARVGVGEGAIVASAAVAVVGSPRVRAHVELERLPLGAVRPDLAGAELLARLDADLAREGRGARGTLDFVSSPFAVRGQRVPRVEAHAELSPRAALLKVQAKIRGAEALASLDLRSKRADWDELSFDIAAGSRELAHVPELRERVSGKLRVSAEGSLDLRSRSLMASASAVLERLRAGGHAVDRAKLRAEARGPLALPELEASLRASGLSAAGRSFRSAHLAVRGPLDALAVTARLKGVDAPDVAARALVRARPTLAVEDLELDLRRDGGSVRVTVARATVAGPSYELSGLRVVGPGELLGSVHIAKERVLVALRADALELGQLARILGIAGAVDRGTLDGRMDLSVRAARVDGSIELALRELDTPQAGRIEGKVELRATGRALRGRVELQADRIGGFVFHSEGVELAPNRSALDLAAWSGATGQATLDGNIELGRLPPLAGQRAFGNARLRLAIAREHAAQLPRLFAELRTRGLELYDPLDEAEAGAPPKRPFLLSALDLFVQVDADGESGRGMLRAAVARRGTEVLTLEAATRAPLAEWLRDRSGVARALSRLPLELRVNAPERPLEELPSRLRLTGIRGSYSAALTASGTFGRPNAKLELRVGQEQAVLARALGSYDGERARVDLSIADRRRQALTARAVVMVSAERLLQRQPAPIVASLASRLQRFELGSIPWLGDRRIGGEATGTLDARALGGRSPVLQANLDFTSLELAGAEFPRGKLVVGADARALDASLELSQREGFARAKLGAGLLSADGSFPRLDPARALRASFEARRLRASALLPALSGSVSELDGRIDAKTELELARGKASLTGQVRLRDGVLQVPKIGQALHDIEADIVAEPGGVVRLRRASLRGTTGKLQATGMAKLDGLSLERAEASLRIDEDDKLPVTVEGVSYGYAWGKVTAKVRPRDVRVDVSSLHLELPAKPKTGVQELDPDPTIKVGVRRQSSTFLELPLQPLQEKKKQAGEPSSITVALGDDVWIRQGTRLRVKLAGEVQTVPGSDRPVRGKIQLAEGRIDVSGKLFEIRSGTIAFQKDPQNPVVLAQAVWDAPEGHRVIAEFVGPVKTGKLKLRAEPPLTENEIVSLILFGEPDGAFGSDPSSGSGGASAAAGVAGGVATQGLGRALSDLTELDVQARIDTESGTGARPELVVQLSPRVSAAVGYNLEPPVPGKSPDRTLLTFELRLRRRWALVTTFGDRGSSLLDLVWRYQY